MSRRERVFLGKFSDRELRDYKKFFVSVSGKGAYDTELKRRERKRKTKYVVRFPKT